MQKPQIKSFSLRDNVGFFVEGIPQVMARKDSVPGTGRVRRRDPSGRKAGWSSNVHTAGWIARSGNVGRYIGNKLDPRQTVYVSVTLYFPPPKGKDSRKDWGDNPMGDGDRYVVLILDALAGVWFANDRQVWHAVTKHYHAPGECPGAYIEIGEVEYL